MKILFTAAIIIIFCGGISLFAKNTTLNEAQTMQDTKSVEFIENKGQIADQNGKVNYDVLFIAEVPYGTVTIRRDGISCSFIKRDEEKLKAQRDRMLSKERFAQQREFEDEAIPTEIYRVDMRLKGSNFNPNFEQFEMTEDYNNYYLAHCPDGITQVRKFKTVKLSDVYPNIDFVVYANNDGLVQYDFVVKPGANPNLINLSFEGAKEVKITSDGNLKVETPYGNIEQKAPVSYQPYDLNDYLNSRDFSLQSQPPSPQTHFTKNSDNTISFNIANYDQSKPLIIDPPTRLWGTYYGGNSDEIGNSVTTDISGSIYLSGTTWSTNAIATTGTHQSTFGGSVDAFLVKFNSSGVRQWGTYYGGNVADYGNSAITDCAS
ncbi:MAG TPA: SBBP repeat-containing protein, partial [Candidatus Kapabacteria bacterium]|nr:SBBP repeat-containing protein [Candidatus Kapabacteria bacterium]